MKNKLSLPTKYIGEFNRAVQKQNKGDFNSAILIYKKLFNFFPNILDLGLNLGTCYFAKNDFHQASVIFHKIHEEYPENTMVLNCAAMAYIQSGNLQIAQNFLKRLVKFEPNNVDAWLNLTFSANGLGNTSDAIYYATQALSLNPTDKRLYNNLGAALVSYHKYKEALICYETVLDLNPNDLKAYMNIATLLDKVGDYSKSISFFEKALLLAKKNTQEEIEVQYRMAYPLLATGELKRGWEYYDTGFKIPFNQGRTPVRTFNAPLWQGEPLGNKTLMIWREQGIGDEIWFFSLIKEVLPLSNKIIIECSDRLVSLLQRAYPSCIVRCQSTLNDFDYQIPAGSLCKIFRSSLLSFPKSKNYLKANEELIKKFSARLNGFKDMLLIGISWRSGNLTTERNIHYAPLSDWEPILRIPNAKFINLQYGEVNQELINVKNHLGIDIFNFDDVNIKDDLESLAAITVNLDLVISVSSFAAPFSQALGKKLKLIHHKNWTMLGKTGKDDWPWFNNVEMYCPHSIDSSISSVFAEVKDDILSFQK